MIQLVLPGIEKIAHEFPLRRAIHSQMRLYVMMLAPFDVQIVIPSRIFSAEQRRDVASANGRVSWDFYASDVHDRREPVEVGYRADDFGSGFDHGRPSHGGRRAQRSIEDVRALVLRLARAGIRRA